ncbi:hypothetical protein HK102_011277, partial [Quaeritorhiza haematococci]
MGLGTPPEHFIAQIAFWVLSMVLVIMSLVCSIQVGYSFRRGSFRRLSVVALKTLRINTKLLGSILFIPVMQLLLMNLECDYHADRLRNAVDLACLSGFNLPFFVISVIGLAIFAPYAIITSSVYFSFDPASKSLNARNPISFYDTVDLSSRVALVISFSLVVQPVFLIILLIVLLSHMLYLHVVSQPFYHQPINQIRCGMLLGALLNSIVALTALFVDKPENDVGFFVAWILAYPTGIVGGYFLANVVKTMICNHVYQRMKSAKERQHQKRLHPNTDKMVLRRSIVNGVEVDAQQDAAMDQLEAGSPRELEENPAGDSSSMQKETGDGSDKDVTPKNLSFAASIGMLVVDMAEAVVATRTVLSPIHPFFRPSDVELSCRFINMNRSPEAKALVREIFEQGLMQFPKNAILRLVYS